MNFSSVASDNPSIFNASRLTNRAKDLTCFAWQSGLMQYNACLLYTSIGVQDQYIVARGGWATDSVMKSVYRGVITDEMKKQSEKINTHFERMQHEMQHEK